MKGFWKRLSYYLFGIGLGVILVLFIFGDRACSWLPGSRIKEDLLNKVIVFPEDQIPKLKEMGITDSTIYNLIIKGDIQFSESIREPNVYPKSYVLTYQKGDTNQRVQFSLYEDCYVTIVHPLDQNEPSKIYKSLKGFGDIVKLPRTNALIFFDESNKTQCKARGLASKEESDIVEDIQNSGKIDFNHSDFMLTKASVRLYFVQNDTLQVKAQTVWYKDRITFKDFIWNSALPCE